MLARFDSYMDGRRIALGVTAGALLALAGCAGGGGPGGERREARAEAVGLAAPVDAAAGMDAIGRLRELAEQARRAPGAAVSLGALGEGWGVAPTDHPERHRMGVEEALASAGTLDGAPAAVAEDIAVDAAAAQRKYASGRLRLLDGDVAGALREWEGALADDPTSPALAGEVGMLQVRAGRRSTGLTTLRGAVENGLRGAEPLRVLAREEFRAGDTQRALALLAAARRDPALARDAMRRRLVDAELGERLADAGYLNAAREVLASLSDLEPSLFGSGAIGNPDFAELLRRRGQLLMRSGDLGAMLGSWESARDAYRAALDVGAVDEGQARLRLAGVSLRAGNPADAALQVVESLPAERLPQPWHFEVAAALKQAAADRAGDGASVADLFARAVRGTKASPTATARRAELASAALASSDALLVLTDAAGNVGAWADRDSLLAALLNTVDEAAGGRADAQRRAEGLIGVVARDPLSAPEAAEALVAHGREVLATQRAIAWLARTQPEGAALAAAIALRLERPAEALKFDEAAGERAQSPAGAPGPRFGAMEAALASARCAALVQLGREVEAIEFAKRWTESSVGMEPAMAARVMIAAGDFDAAAAVLASAGEAEPKDANIDMLALAAQVESQREGKSERAARTLELLSRAAALDPDSPAIADARLALLRPGAANANEQTFASIVRTLRERDAASPLVRRLVTLDLAQRGLWRQARLEAAALMDDRGAPPELIEVLASAWQRGGDKRAAEQDAARFREQHAARPESAMLATHLARALATSGKAEEAEAVLAKQYGVTPLDEIGRQREALIRDVLKRPEDAQKLMLARLANRPATFANQVEFAQTLVRAGSYAQAAVALRAAGVARSSNAEAGTGLSSGGRVAGVLQVARLMRPETVATAPPDEQKGALELLDLARASAGDGAIPADLAAMRVDVLCAIAPEDPGAILDAIDQFASSVSRVGANAASQGRARQEATGRVVQRFSAMDDATPLLRLLEELYVRSEPVSDELGAQWIFAAIIRGDGADNRRMVMFWQDEERLNASLAALQIAAEWAGEGMERARAEFAYLVANGLNAQVREAVAAEVYRLVLEIDPRHGWSGNNYGYMILERGGDIAEAERLIEMAHEQLPDEASVTDTIGWLRYKQGQLEDRALPDGSVREGAVTLLERSAEMVGGESNWEIHDHLADALWRRNRDQADRTRAIELWTNALGQLRDEVMMVRMNNDQSPRLAEYQDRQGQVQAKLTAAKDPNTAHADVPVAPIGIPAVFTPLPEPSRRGVQQERRGVDLLMP